ncbi:hypothetical protein BC940DRAFT_314509 [Gongronella butleri]|nr:hypothetical protein BC940DRAFT_314509 [Gongronella butleri]
MSTDVSVEPRKKRTKIVSACSECRRRKTKCNGEQPCKSCQKSAVPCTYPTISHAEDKRNHLNKMALEAIEQRLQTIEDLLQALLQGRLHPRHHSVNCGSLATPPGSKPISSSSASPPPQQQQQPPPPPPPPLSSAAYSPPLPAATVSPASSSTTTSSAAQQQPSFPTPSYDLRLPPIQDMDAFPSNATDTELPPLTYASSTISNGHTQHDDDPRVFLFSKKRKHDAEL